MRKILLLAAAAAALLCLASCGKMLDRVDDYVISFEIQGHIEDEDNLAILQAYFDEHYLGPNDTFTYHGNQYDARIKAEAFFEERWALIDRELILSCINDEDDIIYLLCIMSGDKTKEIVNYVYWDYTLKESLATE